MKNPWNEIDIEDYENHMKLSSVYQLQRLNQIMGDQFDSYHVSSVMILGVAGGNGLEHIDKNKFNNVYGVDINESYLKTCRKRFPNLQPILKTLCVDLNDKIDELPSADLLLANIVIEYIGYEHFKKVVTTVKPKYVSCVIQVNADDKFVSDTIYSHAFDQLDSVLQTVDEKSLCLAMRKLGYQSISKNIYSLPNGKNFIRLDFIL